MTTVIKKINERDRQNANNFISCLESESAKKRACISRIVLASFNSFLREKGFLINNSNCSDIPMLMDEFDVADIKLESGLKIDIRAIVGDEYPQMIIPKDHRAFEFTPDIYVGAKINKALSQIEFVGFSEARGLDFSSSNRNYFFVDITSLRSMTDFSKAAKSILPKQHMYLTLDHNNARDLFLSFIDGKLSGLDKEFLIKHLATCESCRVEFNELYHFNRKLNSIKRSDLIYYFNLHDLEEALPVNENKELSEEIEIGKIKSKSSFNPGIIGRLKGILSFNATKPDTLVGLSSLATTGMAGTGLIRDIAQDSNSSVKYTRYIKPGQSLAFKQVYEEKALQEFEQASGEIFLKLAAKENELEYNEGRIFRKLAEQVKVEDDNELDLIAELSEVYYTPDDNAGDNLGDNNNKETILDEMSEKYPDKDNVEALLSSLDEIEIIDSTEVAKRFAENQSQEDSSEKVVNIVKVKKKSYIAKTAAVLVAAGVLTSFGFVLNDYYKLKLADRAMAEQTKETESYQNSYNRQDYIPQQAAPVEASYTQRENELSYTPYGGFNLDASGVRISNVAWEVGASLANDPVFRNYLVVAGQALKANLGKGLLNTREKSLKNELKVQIVLDLDGNILDGRMKIGSGSRQIDDIVLQTVKETLSYTKIPQIQTNKKYIKTNIIISL